MAKVKTARNIRMARAMEKLGVGKMGSSNSEAKAPKNKLSELLEWVARTNGNVKSGCTVCQHSQAAQGVKEILQAMIKLAKPNISVTQIFTKIKEETGIQISSVSTMQRHLTRCELDLWNQAKGK